jgi:hypothetical protein
VEVVGDLRRYVHNRTGANGVFDAINGGRQRRSSRPDPVPENPKAQRGNPEELPIDSSHLDFGYVQHGHDIIPTIFAALA